MNVKISIVDFIQTNKNYNDMDTQKERMAQELTPSGRRKRGRPPTTWIEEIQSILREREIKEDLWFRKLCKHCAAGIKIIFS